ncbi:MAG TPA: MarR family transcriptional regulator [Pseudonocardiaceae bacterium]|jgi:DNA-binding MarR family transcriptional regulator|nr:MarR family transcriptional regulator [Pseudonocardiaceae bacterium]
MTTAPQTWTDSDRAHPHGTQPDRSQPDRTQPDRAQLAGRSWSGLRTLVLDLHDRRKEVSVALEMGFIRAKALMKVAAAPSKLRDLAVRLGTDAPYTTLIVDDLEKRGLVIRTPHPDDRRSKLVTATEAGLAAAALANGILGEPPAALLGLDTEDLVVFDRIVTTLLASVADEPLG